MGMIRIMWFLDKQEAIDLAERIAKDNGCTAKKEGCTWEAYNPACPEVNAVVVQKARQYEPNGPEGYEVIIRCNMYGEQEKWPAWLSDQGITPGQRYPIGGAWSWASLGESRRFRE
ncbi:MAG: hypothetical protein AB1652_07575 [Bacillota bacterium]